MLCCLIFAKNPAPATLREAGSDCSCYLEQSQREEKLCQYSEDGKSSSQSRHLLQHWIIDARENGKSGREGSARLLSFLRAQRLGQAMNPPCAGNAGKGSVRISTLEETWVKLKVITSKSHPGVKVAEPQKLLQSRGADSARLCKLQGWDQEKPPASNSDPQTLHKGPFLFTA